MANKPEDKSKEGTAGKSQAEKDYLEGQSNKALGEQSPEKTEEGEQKPVGHDPRFPLPDDDKDEVKSDEPSSPPKK